MSNAKLEFIRFQLRHKSGTRKTFRRFMLDIGKCTARQKDKNIFLSLYKYFMEQPTKGFAKINSLKKVVTLIPDKKVNKFFDERPMPDFSSCIISGVINGGPFGKERIVTNLKKKQDVGNLSKDQPVLQYYYIFAYLPLDYDEGFIMIHTDSAEDSILQPVRKYVSNLFKVNDYQKPIITNFVPKNFWDEYKRGATLTSMTFQKTFVDNQIGEDDPIKEIVKEFDVKITLAPKKKSNINCLESVKKYFANKIFGSTNNQYRLEDAEKISVNTKNSEIESTKTFDWNDRDQELMPTVYLKGRVALDDAGTPVFNDLNKYCHKLFREEILPELRPDLNVTGVD